MEGDSRQGEDTDEWNNWKKLIVESHLQQLQNENNWRVTWGVSKR